MGYLFVRDGIARDTIGKEGDKFVPCCSRFFFLVWVLNFMGIVPVRPVPGDVASSRSRVAFARHRLPDSGCRSASYQQGVGGVLQGHDDARRTCPRRCTSC